MAMLAYVHIFKTAGTTLTGILRRNFSIRHFDTRLIQEKPAITAAQLKRAMLVYPRLESIAGHAVRTHSDLRRAFPEIRFYTMLREPRQRLVSAFVFIGSNEIRHGRWKPSSNDEIESRLDKMIGGWSSSYCKILNQAHPSAEAAIETIETELDFVGLVEAFDESLALFRNWIGKPKFDIRYRRLNDSARRGGEQRRFKAIAADVTDLNAAARRIAQRPDMAEKISKTVEDDIKVYEHVRSKTFERMRRLHSAGSGPFQFEMPSIAADTVPSRLLRDLVGRPLIPLLTGSAANVETR